MACKSILVVEDDYDIREALIQLLELEGYKGVGAANGREAIEMLKKIEKPCMILLDLMMPIMNGWEFLEARKQNAMLASIPVVVASAVADEVPREQKLLGLLKKPVELEALLGLATQSCELEDQEHLNAA